MAVIVITSIYPPETGFGGNFVIPVMYHDNMIAGSLRSPNDMETVSVVMSNNGIASSLRAPEDNITTSVNMNLAVPVVDTIMPAPSNGAVNFVVNATNAIGSPDPGII